MAKSAAEARREKLRNRTRQSVQTRDEKGLGRKSILDWGRFDGEKPPVYVLKHGTKDNELNVLDILPFVITQSWYKDLRTKSGLTTNLDVGDWDYKLEIPVHPNVGDNNDVLICNRLAFGGKCPDCEDMFAEYEKDSPDKDTIRNLSPSWRCFYNIYDYIEESNPDGVNMILENVAYGNMEKAVLAKAGEGEEEILFSDIEEGKTLKMKGREESFGGNKYTKILNEDYVEFEDREPYPESVVEETVSFDALVKLCTYDEFLAIRKGESEAAAPKEEKSAGSGTRTRRQPTSDKKEGLSVTKCPAGLEFGKPDLDSEDCKKCDDETFKACADAEQANADARKEPEQEETPPASGRRRRTRK